ncbi:MAG TPA: hypothetical protein VFN13_02915 [Rudaea sp.]|nr:hypothetical protein [Rudaea sp.]
MHYSENDVIGLSLYGDGGIVDAASARSISAKTIVAATLAHETNHIEDQKSFGQSSNSLEERIIELKSARDEANVYEGLKTDAPWDAWTNAGGYDTGAVENEASAATSLWCSQPDATCP